MLKDLLKEGGLYTIANLLTKGVSLMLIPFYTSYFTTSDYGVIDILALFGSFVINVLILQLNRGLSRHVAEPKLEKSEKIVYASTAIWSTIGLLVFGYLILVFNQDSIISYLSADKEIEKTTYLLAITSVVLNAFFYLLGVYLRSLRRSKEFATISFLHAVLGILGVLLLVIKFDYGINSVYLSFIIIVPILIVYEIYLLRGYIKMTFDFSILKKLLHYSVPLVPASIAVIVMNFSDRIYIKEYLNFSELGVYAVGTKFSTIIGIVIAGFSMAITPLIIENQYKEETKKELTKIFDIFISFGTIGVLLLTLFSKEIINVFTTKNFHNASDVMPLMFLTAYFVGFSMFSYGLILKKKTIISSLLVIVFAGLNITLNIYLIPKYGIMGAALATLISTLSYQFCLFYIARKYFKFPFKWIKISMISGFHILIIGTIMYWNPEINVVNFGVKLILLFFYIFLLFFIKVLNINSILNFIKRK